MFPSRPTIRRHARQLARRIATRSLVSVGVMVSLQVGTSLSSAPYTNEVTPRMTVRALPAAAASAHSVFAGELKAIATERESRLPVPAQLAASAARASVLSVPAEKPVVRVASLRTPSDAVMFDTCLPECESRDPLLRETSPAIAATPSAEASIVLADAVAEPVTASTVPVAPAHDSLLRVVARRGTAIAGAAASSALGGVVRLTAWRNDL